MRNRSTGKIIRSLRRKKKMTMKELGKKVGLTESAIGMIERDERNPSIDKIPVIASVLNVSPSYLMGWNEFTYSDINKAIDYLTSVGWNRENLTDSLDNKAIVELANKHYREAPEAKEIFSNILNERDGKQSTQEQILQKFKLFENPVSAGRGTWLDEGTEYNYIEIEHPPVSADFALRVRGDSMSPKYNDGDVVFVKSRTLLEPGQVGVFLINGEGYLKQWQGNMLLSLNREYDPIYVEEDDEFMIVGKVIEKIERLD